MGWLGLGLGLAAALGCPAAVPEEADDMYACDGMCEPGEVLWSLVLPAPIDTGDAGARGLTVDPGKGVYVTGFAERSTSGSLGDSGNMDLALARVSLNGELLWETFHGSLEGAYDVGDAVTLDRAGRPVVAARGLVENGAGDILIHRFSAEGVLDWTLTETGNNFCADSGRGIATLNDGSLVATGRVCLGDGGVWIQRIFDDGTPGPRRIIAPAAPPWDAYGDDIIVTRDGTIIVVGTMPDDTNNPVQGEQVIWYAAYTSELEELWSITSHAGLAHGVAELPDGDLIVVGERLAPGSDGEAWIARLDGADGSQYWSVAVATAGPWRADAVAIDSAGDVVIAGAVGEPFPRAWIAKYSPDGEERWSVVEQIEPDGIARALAVGIGPEDSIYIAGQAQTIIGAGRLWLQRRAP